MSLSQKYPVLAAADCEVRWDNLTRQLYATDASIYQVEPVGVAFPQNSAQASSVIQAAAESGLSVIPRGAGSGLVGGAIGPGLILDFSRHNRQITDLDLEARSVRVGAGVVLDQLNVFLQPHGFCFGPDVATSSRATLGGMIASDSSGARTPVYGTTAVHVRSLEIVLTDGRIETIGPGSRALSTQRERVKQLVRSHAEVIRTHLPEGLLKRRPGYGLRRLLEEPGNLNHALAGSEGTLSAIMAAELNIVPLPKEKGLGIIFFASVAEAMQATIELLSLKPAAIEHVDRVLFDQTRGQLQFRAARDLLQLNSDPCEAFLIIEFYEDVKDRLAALSAKRLGLRTLVVREPREMNWVWALRKAGLSLLTGCPGSAKPVTGIEDAAVRPEHLPSYVAGLKSILKSLDLQACFYGHAASGLLHVRPVLDLHSATDLGKFRQVCDEVSALVKQFKGSLTAEHGVGIARTEYLAAQLGEELLGVMREVKRIFDPEGVFNPGKIIPDARYDYRIDAHLRLGANHGLTLPFEPMLAFAAEDGSFAANLEQCNGCGGCRKNTPTMCPTFAATGEEIMSTRGRANLIRAALEMRGLEDRDALRSLELETALSNCLSCKACATECPSNVNLPLLKAELLNARYQRDGLPLRARVISAVDFLGRIGCQMPALANTALEWPWLRKLMEISLGFSAKRALPKYTSHRFDRWFAQHQRSREASAARKINRGKVILWDDTFVRYHEPHIGQAAVTVLEAAGFEVMLPTGRKCCGRPAFSQGYLEEVRRLGTHNLNMLAPDEALSTAGTSNPRNTLGTNCDIRQALTDSASPILFLEPSCWSMFTEDYRELKLPGAEAVAKRCFLFERFIEDLLQTDATALAFQKGSGAIAIHAHCHAKSLLNPAFMAQLAERFPACQVTLLETGCCGMAGAFGMMASKQDLSVQVAQSLLDKVSQLPPDTTLVASGTSCRQQIAGLCAFRPKHMAEVIAERLPAISHQ